MNASKRILTGVFALGMIALVFASPAPIVQSPWAPVTGNGSEKNLSDIINSRISGGPTVDVNNDRLVPANSWISTATQSSATQLIIEFAGFSLNNSFGIYNTSNPNQLVEVYSGANAGGSSAAITFGIVGGTKIGVSGFDQAGLSISKTYDYNFSSFGFYLKNIANDGGFTFYSDAGMNSDGKEHMVAYQGKDQQFSIYNNGSYAPWTKDEYILGWEDKTTATGSDWDFNDMVVMVESVQVPEPGILSLFGAGLLAFIGMGWIRKRK